MTQNTILFITTAILLVFFFAGGFYFGWDYTLKKNTPITIQSIEKYIEEKFPDLWSAYKKGVFEGYEQGLRDGKESDDEPA